RRSGAPVIRTVLLTTILMFSGAVLLSVNNPPFLQKAVEARPEIELITGMLARWPEQAVDTVQAMISGSPSIEEQTRPSVFDQPAEFAPSSALSTDTAQAIPVPPPPDALSMEPSLSTAVTKTASVTDEIKERRLTEAQKREIRTLLEEAKTDYAEHRLVDVEMKLNRLIDLNPKVPMAYHLLGTVLLERKDTQRAMRIFEEASRKFPDYALLRYDLGFLYYQQGVVFLAVNELKTALKINASLPAAERAQEILKDLEQKPKKRQALRKDETASSAAPAPALKPETPTEAPPEAEPGVEAPAPEAAP
ncbi:MAG TPA: tetratricopeptide repeat protein, partial [Nitrospiria bacterium]